jgi:uncharacterized protein Usg
MSFADFNHMVKFWEAKTTGEQRHLRVMPPALIAPNSW